MWCTLVLAECIVSVCVVCLSVGRMCCSDKYRICHQCLSVEYLLVECVISVCVVHCLLAECVISVCVVHLSIGRMCHQCVCGTFVYWRNVSSVCEWFPCLSVGRLSRQCVNVVHLSVDRMCCPDRDRICHQCLTAKYMLVDCVIRVSSSVRSVCGVLVRWQTVSSVCVWCTCLFAEYISV